MKEMIENEKQETVAGVQYKRRRLKDLSTGDRVSIVHAVMVEHQFRRDVAREYRVSVDMVTRLTSQLLTDRDAVHSWRAEEAKKERRITIISCASAELQQNHGYIPSVKAVKE